MQITHGFTPLGAAPDSPIKNQIFGLNAARLYGLEDAAKLRPFDSDTAAAIRADYRASGGRTLKPALWVCPTGLEFRLKA